MTERLELHEPFKERSIKVAPARVVFSARRAGPALALRARRRVLLALLDGEGDPHPLLIVGLLLVGVVDVADQHVAPSREVEGQALRVADRDVLDLALQLEALTLLVDRAILDRR